MKLRYKLAFAAICLGILAMMVLSFGGEAIQKAGMKEYHQAMTSGPDLLTLTGQRGTKFTVYDKDRQQYRSDCLPEELLAKSPDEVAGVFVITLREEKIGSYSTADAIRYYQVIELYECDEGTMVRRNRVNGKGTPPSRRKMSFFDWHSKKPTPQQISDQCASMTQAVFDKYDEHDFDNAFDRFIQKTND